MTNINSKFTWNGEEVLVEWMPGGIELIKKYKPITQALGLCVNDNNEVIIVSDDEGKNWGLPGGTVEPGETIQQTLEREVMEEVDIEISEIKFLGLQKIINKSNIIYQSRFFCRVKKVLPQTIDPAKGKILMRKFVPLRDLNKILKWGAVLDELVRLSMNNLSDRSAGK
ncbi:MAG: NUDIX hydrolase [Patescibacteria group bacterium]|nr:NUDIX hydrolase [Patescibacteria group bacterium]